MVIEAIFEDLDAKQALYAPAEPRMRAGAVLASNTSSLTLESLAATLQRSRAPGRSAFLQSRWRRCRWSRWCIPPTPPGGAHERRWALRAASTSCRCPAAAARAFWSIACCSPTCTRPCTPPVKASHFDAIDRAAVEFGMPMGPIELSRCGGAGRAAARGRDRYARTAAASRRLLSRQVRELVQAGKLGRKSGQGFYTLARGQGGARRSRARRRPRI